MPGLDDYGALLRSGAASVPDYADQEAKRQLMMLKKQELGLQTAQFAQKLQQKQAFDTDVAGVLADPNPTNISALMLKHPEFADQVKGAWDIKDKAVKDADLTQLSEIYSAANAGKWDIAAQTARARLEADKAAGHADAGDEQIVNALENGTPEERKAALGMIGVNLAAATGAEHFGTVYGALKGGYTLGAGDTRFDENGNIIAQSPFLKTADGGIIERNGTGAGGTGAPATSGDGGGFDNAINFVLKHEGGYNSSDRNGAPVNFGINQKANPDVDVKNLTADQAKQLYLDRYWKPSGAENLPPAMQTPYFDTYVLNPERAQQMLKASGNDPTKFLQLRQNWLKSLEKSGKYDKAWTQRTNDLMAMTNGAASDDSSTSSGSAPPGYHILVPGREPPKQDSFRILTPEEAQARGLDPNLKFQINDKNGQITALGGQGRQTKQIPQAVVSKAQPTVDVRDTMARLAGTWKPDFGGHTILGDNLNTLQRNIGSLSGAPEGMADWWADYQSMDNVIRNQLFGSALTEHEKQAYAATTITPRMDPKQIVERFNRRRAIINAVAARQQNFLKKNGYDPDAVDALFAPLGGGGESSGPVKVNSVQEAQKLAPGTMYVAPDGKVRRR